MHAGYLRASKDDQLTENQRIKIQQYCEGKGINVTFFSENESSRNTRPIKEALLQRVRRGEFESIIVFRFDRWARSLSELILDMQSIQDAGVNFISITENVDLTTSTGKLMFGIIASFAEFERNLIRERTMAGLDRARAQGKTLGRPSGAKDKRQRSPDGYKNRYRRLSGHVLLGK